MPSRIKVTDTADYISKAAPEAQPILQQLTDLIQTELPAAEPKIKWNLPFWNLGKQYVSVAGYKDHVSLSLSEDLTDELLTAAKAQGYATGQKRLNVGLDQAVPVPLVKAVLGLLK